MLLRRILNGVVVASSSLVLMLNARSGHRVSHNGRIDGFEGLNCQKALVSATDQLLFGHGYLNLFLHFDCNLFLLLLAQRDGTLPHSFIR